MDTILAMIKEAKEFINLSTMLFFFNDPEGQTIAQALIEAARDGVQVRLMVDRLTTAIGNNPHVALPFWDRIKRGDFGILGKRMKNAGIHIVHSENEIYDQTYWKMSKRSKLADEGVPELFLKIQDFSQKEGGTKSLNCAYHRKFMVVDNKQCWLGSVNIGSEYLWEGPTVPSKQNPRGIPPDRRSWHDGLFVIKSPVFAKKLNVIFAQQWMVLGGDIFDLHHNEDDIPDYGDGADMCAIFTSFPGNPGNCCFEYHEQLVKWCKGNAIISNPYIIDENWWKNLHHLPDQQYPKLHFITCLKETDHEFAPPSVRAHAGHSAKRGTKWTDYSAEEERFSHWKVAIDFDTKCVFHGSTNLNTRSDLHDFEINVLVKSNRLFKEVKTLLEYDIAVGKIIPEKDYKGARLVDHAVTGATAYFS